MGSYFIFLKAIMVMRIYVGWIFIFHVQGKKEDTGWLKVPEDELNLKEAADLTHAQKGKLLQSLSCKMYVPIKCDVLCEMSTQLNGYTLYLLLFFYLCRVLRYRAPKET